MIVYDKLFDLLENRHYTTTAWMRKHGIHAATVDKLRKNKTVTTETIDRLCELLSCQPGDILTYIPMSESSGVTDCGGIKPDQPLPPSYYRGQTDIQPALDENGDIIPEEVG